MKIITKVLIYLCLVSCSQAKKTNKVIYQKEVKTMNQISLSYDTLIYNVKYNGNIDCYDELYYSFMDSNKSERTDSLMIYSKIMAERYNYKKAYFDYFKALCEKQDIEVNYSDYKSINIRNMDESSKKIGVDWLKTMVESKIITNDKFNEIKK
jgi:hypothetical protein